VSREVQAVVLLVIGVVIGRLTLSDAYLGFVKDTLRLPLLASAAVLITLGLLSLLRDQEDELAGDEHGDDGHGHDHATAPRIGMLMLAPVLALLLVAPQPLGAYAANRGGANRVAAPVLQLDPLAEPVDGAVPITIGDAVVRALYEPDGPLEGTTVRMVGFVSTDDALAGYRLSRFSVSCCAADASVRQVVVAGGSPRFEDDTWVEVTARFEGAIHDPDGDGGATGIPIVQLVAEREIERPASPYEY
jgi:uncharacterized repeat protein (TIGR03943 family)